MVEGILKYLYMSRFRKWEQLDLQDYFAGKVLAPIHEDLNLIQGIHIVSEENELQLIAPFIARPSFHLRVLLWGRTRNI